MIYNGFDNAVGFMMDKQSGLAIGAFICGFIFGICFIIFSKRLARLFCRGLDDDAA